MENNNAIPVGIRRRRRKKNASASLSTSNEPGCFASTSSANQDAELEREVDSYMNWGRSHNAEKRQRRGYGGSDKGAMASAGADVIENCQATGIASKNTEVKDVSTSLPILLHLREIGGLPRPRQLSVTNTTTMNSWKSMILQESISKQSKRKGRGGVIPKQDNEKRYSNLARLRHPVHPSLSTYNNSQWKALQYSSPTYYAITTNNKSSRQCWRTYTQQQIPFSKLQTPHSDAILALDRWGAYMVGIGTSRIRDYDRSKGLYPHLSIEFYGVPSPARLLQIESKDSVYGSIIKAVSPHVLTVPLLLKNSSSVENRNFPAPSSILGHNEYASPVAETPIQILLSECGSLGVAFLHHSTAAAWSNHDGSSFSQSPALKDEDILGTIVIFEPPRVASDQNTAHLAKSFRCSNVRIGGWTSMRNALWPATLIPTIQSGQHAKVESKENLFNSAPILCNHLRRVLSAYMLFNDEDDGFRITWIRNHAGSVEENAGICATKVESNTATSGAIRPARSDILEQTDGNIWEECLSDPSTGQRLSDGGDNQSQSNTNCVEVSFEVYLHVDALLSDILSRRQSSLFKKSPYQTGNVFFMPDFFYSLVSASPDNLGVVLVIVFSNREKMMAQSAKNVPSSLGVFVRFNLLDQSYEELKWVQHPSCDDTPSMKRWCNSLALNWRMKECRVGVFCLDSSKIAPHLDQWVGSTHECNVDEDLLDDYNFDLWNDYVERRNSAQKKGNVTAPKDVSMSSLYPYCDVITNRAVHNAIPVKRIASRKSPIELIYG